jgi:hypothetical protein
MPVTFLLPDPAQSQKRKEGATTMKKVLTVIAVTFALVVGTTAVMTVHPQQAIGECTGSNC